MPEKSLDTRLTVTLSSFAYREIMELAELLESKPATLSVRPIEDWVASDEFLKLKERAKQSRSKETAK